MTDLRNTLEDATIRDKNLRKIVHQLQNHWNLKKTKIY